MKIKSLLLICYMLALTVITAYSQAPVIQWQKTIGGSKNDSLLSIEPTNDGGFIISGFSNSNISGNKTQEAINNSYDYWILKLDAAGNVLWNKTIGGSGSDINPVGMQTSDGGFLISGQSISNLSGNKTEDAINASYDYWVVKLDESGNVLWENTIGGIQYDYPTAIAEASDGTYRIAGCSYSSAIRGYDKTIQNRGSNLWSDYWIVKLRKNNGSVLWNKEYGGGNEDILTSISKTSDNGFVMGGYSYSPAENEKTESFLGNNDYWIVKVDAEGNKRMDKVIGGRLSDYQTCLKEHPDGGYILGGYSNSPISFNKSQNPIGGMDFWMVKMNVSGVVQLDKTIGGSLSDYLSSIDLTADGGYILGGTSNSGISGNKSENTRGKEDYWIVKLDGSGNIQWDKTIGGSGIDKLSTIRALSNNEYILGGTSSSPISGDKTENTVGNSGLNDYWIVKLGSASQQSQTQQSAVSGNILKPSAEVLNIKKLTLQATPNPTQGLVNLSYTSADNKKLSLMVYDIHGKTIKQANLPSDKSTFKLDLSRYASGTYYVVITNNTSSVTRIVVKQ